MICFIGLYFHSYPILIIGRLISALGAASGLACTFMLINEWLPEGQRRTAIAYSILSFTLGIGLAVILGGLITEYSHWGNCFVLLLVHGLLMFYGTRVFSETLTTTKAINISSIIKGYKNVLASGSLLTYSLVVGLCSAIGYCFSAAGPLIAKELFHLSPAKYGYWNCFNILGMLLGGLLAKVLLQRFSPSKVVVFGLVGTALGIGDVLLMTYFGSASALWFFTSTLVMYLFSGFLFSGGSYIASNSVSDKASGAAMMSFINMMVATLAVILMGYISSNPLIAFIMTLGALWAFVSVVLFIQRCIYETKH
jgi:MFS family permease